MKSSRKPSASDRHVRSPICWCGNDDLKPFSDDYLCCAQCETLVLRHMPTEDVTRVRDDSSDLYGQNYYLKHLQQDFGYPDLTTRARTDLPERCLHWLRTTLKYKVPPGKALELGSAHGAFVALLRWTGFDATGLELSPWVVNFAKGVFDVPMLSGPIEDQNLAPRSLNVIALMDVLEHLPSPLATMERCLRLLKEDGILVIQTPRYPEASSYEEMVAQRNPFLEQLKASDHLYLYSQKSVQELLRRLGIAHAVFEPAIFAHYDMCVVASPGPLSINSHEQIEIILSTTPASCLIQALLDTDGRSRDLQGLLGVADADRAARLKVIQQQAQRTTELEADRAVRLENIQRLEQLLGESEQDRAARLGVIKTQSAQVANSQIRLTELQQRLETSEKDHAARLNIIQTQNEQLAGLQTRLAESHHRLEKSEADRAARLENIQCLEQLLKESEQDRAARLDVIQTQGAQVTDLQTRLTQLEERLETSETDRAARLENIQRLEQLLQESERDRAARLNVIQTQGAQVADLQARLTEFQQQLETSEADQALRNKEINEQRSLTAKLVEVGARLEKEIDSLGQQLKVIGHERDELRTALAGLRQQLELSEVDRVSRGEEIDQQRRKLEEADFKHKRLQVEINYSKAHAGEMQTTLQQLGDNHAYRVMRALGLWRSIATSAGADPTAPNAGDDGTQKILRRVVVDLTRSCWAPTTAGRNYSPLNWCGNLRS